MRCRNAKGGQSGAEERATQRFRERLTPGISKLSTTMKRAIIVITIACAASINDGANNNAHDLQNNANNTIRTAAALAQRHGLRRRRLL
jgi:hypothetical protein